MEFPHCSDDPFAAHSPRRDANSAARESAAISKQIHSSASSLVEADHAETYAVYRSRISQVENDAWGPYSRIAGDHESLKNESELARFYANKGDVKNYRQYRTLAKFRAKCSTEEFGKIVAINKHYNVPRNDAAFMRAQDLHSKNMQVHEEIRAMMPLVRRSLSPKQKLADSAGSASKKAGNVILKRLSPKLERLYSAIQSRST